MSIAETSVSILVVLVGVGAFFGIVLALADKKFYMQQNPLIGEVEDILPKGQCGACGFAGCAKYAEAVVENPDVPSNLCVPGKAAVATAAAPAKPAASSAVVKTSAKAAPVPTQTKAQEEKADVEKKADAPASDATKPAVEEPVVETPAEKYVNYTVQDGEDLVGISINFDLTTSEIRQLNNLSDDAPVTPGMVLKLPAGSVQAQ